MVAQRGAAMDLPFKWEFPGGKVEPGEIPGDALRREIIEELGIEIGVGELLGRSEWRSEGTHIVLDVYCARWLAGEIELLEHAQVGWFEGAELHALDWAPADIPVVEGVAAALLTQRG